MILARDKDIALLFQGVSKEARTRKDSKGFPLGGTMRSKKELLERYFEWEPKGPTQKVDQNAPANKLKQAQKDVKLETTMRNIVKTFRSMS